MLEELSQTWKIRVLFQKRGEPTNREVPLSLLLKMLKHTDGRRDKDLQSRINVHSFYVYYIQLEYCENLCALCWELRRFVETSDENNETKTWNGESQHDVEKELSSASASAEGIELNTTSNEFDLKVETSSVIISIHSEPNTFLGINRCMFFPVDSFSRRWFSAIFFLVSHVSFIVGRFTWLVVWFGLVSFFLSQFSTESSQIFVYLF